MSSWAIASLVLVGICVLTDLAFSIGCGVGGFVDLKYLVKALRTAEVDETDDGRVVD